MDENILVVASSKQGGKKKVIYKSKEFVFNKSLKDSTKYVCRYQAGKVLFSNLSFKIKCIFLIIKKEKSSAQLALKWIWI